MVTIAIVLQKGMLLNDVDALQIQKQQVSGSTGEMFAVREKDSSVLQTFVT